MIAGCGFPSPATQHAPTPTGAPIADARPSPHPSDSSATPLPTIRPAPQPTARPTPLPVSPAPTRVPPPTALPPTPAVLSVEERRQIFEEVWRTVKEHYLYEDFNGVDWDAVRDEYAPRVESSASRDAFYAAMIEMVAQLDDQHSRFLPPTDAQLQDATVAGREVAVGIGIITKPKPDGAFIQVVFPDSPADRAGLRPRDRIIAVDGRSYRPDDGDLHGPAGSVVRLNVLRPGDRPRDVVLVRQEVQSQFGPTYRRFPGDIGYVSIQTLWVSNMDEQVSGALTELVAAGPLNGLILDVRGNPGGWGYVLSGILSHFVRGQVGLFYDRHTTRPLDVKAPAGPDLRSLPLVVLVDSDTASYAEVLAAVLQREAQALVIGTPTAGNTETIYAYTLKDGSRLWLAQESFRLRNGVNIEGNGIQPDLLLDVDWTRYSEDDDPQLLEALRLLGAGPK